MKHAPLTLMLTSAALALALGSTPVLARSHHDESKAKAASLYPNATRKAPKLDLTSEKESKALNAGLQAVNAGDKAKATQLLQPIIDGSKSKYAKALALQGMASISYNAGDVKGAIKLLQQSLADGVMPNDTYFQLEYELGQFYMADQQYQKSIDTIEQWRAQGKRETAESYALEGNAYYRMQKYPEAIAAIKKAESMSTKPEPTWNEILMASYSESGQGDQAIKIAEQQLAANPSDQTALNNAVTVLMQAQKYPEAIKVLEQARAQGNLKSEKQYINLAKMYLITGQNSSSDPKPYADKAIAVLNDGMSKGVVTSTAANYTLLGDAALIGGEKAKALAAYKKAIPTAQDGEAAVRAGQVMLLDHHYYDARKLIKQGIDKGGLKHTGTAYMMLAEAYRGMKDKPDAIAAVRKAEQYPETASKAKAWLQKAHVGR
ncbi:tetratricopeptide repeat protein [Dyella sp. A6]|uniref:tetratricopeptide repeat protein n=1 Tax=Dyella aluminiiresistens TaxID=3069105 RepID=UPI002E78CFC3|nr:tetratricopeptide repeat protein [Dyella sp. A6]